MRLVSSHDPDFAEAAYGRIFNARKPAAAPVAVAQPETPGDVAEATAGPGGACARARC